MDSLWKYLDNFPQLLDNKPTHGGNGPHLPYGNRDEARLSLRQYVTDPLAMRAFRRYLHQQNVRDVSRMEDHAVIEEMAHRMVQASFGITAMQKAKASAFTSVTAQAPSPQDQTTPEQKPATTLPRREPSAKAEQTSQSGSPSPQAPPAKTIDMPKADQTSALGKAEMPLTSVSAPTTGASANPFLTPALATPAITALPDAPIMAQTKSEDKQKSLSIRWLNLVAYCGDKMELLAEATGIGNTDATVEIIHPEKGTIAQLKGSGSSTFSFPWQVKDAVFSGSNPPEKYQITAKISAGGLTAVTASPLVIKPLPDIAPSWVTITSKMSQTLFETKPDKDGNEVEQAKLEQWEVVEDFQLSLHGNQIEIYRPLHFIKTWLGKTVGMDPTNGEGKFDIYFVKKFGTTWMFYDGKTLSRLWKGPQEGQWRPLPRHISPENLVSTSIRQKGSQYVSEDDMIWPGLIDDTMDDQRINQWLEHITYVWDDRFELHDSQCVSSAKDCCTWRVRISTKWLKEASDDDYNRTVNAVMGEEWERSDSENWHLCEKDLTLAPHEFGHLLGLADEYSWKRNAAFDEEQPFWDRNLSYDRDKPFSGTDSIMACDSPRVHPRYLKKIVKQIEQLILKNTGRQVTLEVREGVRYNDHEECPTCGKWVWPEKFQGELEDTLYAHGLCYDCYWKKTAPLNAVSFDDP